MFFYQTPTVLVKLQINGFLIEILDILKICDKSIPYNKLKINQQLPVVHRLYDFVIISNSTFHFNCLGKNYDFSLEVAK